FGAVAGGAKWDWRGHIHAVFPGCRPGWHHLPATLPGAGSSAPG
nr:hypothetical protein [Tanacetum cinerariifolium]